MGGVGDGSAVGKEQQLAAALRRALPGITYLSVEDISGGCGAMFEVIYIIAIINNVASVSQTIASSACPCLRLDIDV